MDYLKWVHDGKALGLVGTDLMNYFEAAKREFLEMEEREFQLEMAEWRNEHSEIDVVSVATDAGQNVAVEDAASCAESTKQPTLTDVGENGKTVVFAERTIDHEESFNGHEECVVPGAGNMKLGANLSCIESADKQAKCVHLMSEDVSDSFDEQTRYDGLGKLNLKFAARCFEHNDDEKMLNKISTSDDEMDGYEMHGVRGQVAGSYATMVVIGPGVT